MIVLSKVAVILSTLAIAMACAPGARPFKIVQFCVDESVGFERLSQTLRDIAREEAMQFSDSSVSADATASHLADFSGNPSVHRGPIYSVRLVGEKGLSIGANNDGLFDQVMIGFSTSGRVPEVQEVVERVVNRLEETWRVREVAHPESSGAFPIEGCASEGAQSP